MKRLRIAFKTQIDNMPIEKVVLRDFQIKVKKRNHFQKLFMMRSNPFTKQISTTIQIFA